MAALVGLEDLHGADLQKENFNEGKLYGEQLAKIQPNLCGLSVRQLGAMVMRPYNNVEDNTGAPPKTMYSTDFKLYPAEPHARSAAEMKEHTNKHGYDIVTNEFSLRK